MSIVSDIHSATIYDAKASKPFEGQRLIKTIAKADSKGNYGPHLQQTMCTSVPLLVAADIDWASESVQSACTEYFRTVQNSLVNERIKEGNKDVTTAELGQASLLSYLLSETVGDKWDTVRIASWFTDNIAEYVVARLMALGKEDTFIESSVTAYAKLFADTFSSKAKIPMHTALTIEKAFKTIPEDAMRSLDTFGVRIAARVEQVIRPKMEEALDLGL